MSKTKTPTQFDIAAEDDQVGEPNDAQMTTHATPGHGAYAPGLVSRVGLALGRQLPKGRAGLRLAGAVRPIALLGVIDGTSDVEAFGLKLRLHPQDNLSEKRIFLTPQCFDPEELEAVRVFMSKGQKTFMDVGANAGAYALVAARAGGQSARVIAVEPQAEMRRRLLFNARQNGLEAVEVTGVALSDYEGEDVMRLVSGNHGGAALGGRGDGEAVRVTTLPKLMDEMSIDRVDAMKIDVEGGEMAILSALFKNTDAERWPSLLILERADLAGRDAPDAAALAQAKGYRVKTRTRMNVILER